MAGNAKDTNSARARIPGIKCFAHMNEKDTVFLKLEKFPHVVTGILQYKLSEKDANYGELDGRLHGDTLVADYKFESEGKESIRQVVFLIKDNMAKEGYGDMEEKKGKMVFKDVDDVDFDNSPALSETACPIE